MMLGCVEAVCLVDSLFEGGGVREARIAPRAEWSG